MPDKANCPIVNSHRRLNEATITLDEAVQNYHVPDMFAMKVNQTIQALRNVTFMLQGEKSAIPNFDEWYSPQVELLKKDPVMAWLNKARTVVVKQRDLEISSFAYATICNWSDHPLFKIKVSPLLTASEFVAAIFETYPQQELKKEFGDTILKAERFWAIPEFPEREILDLLCYGKNFLAKLIAEAHDICNCSFNLCPLFKPISIAVLDTDPIRISHLNPANGEIIGIEFESTDIDLDKAEIARERYGIDNRSRSVKDISNLFECAETLLEQAKKILIKDGYHQTFAFLKIPSNGYHPAVLPFKNQAEKYLVFKSLAKMVHELEATGIILISEAWITKEIKKDQRPSESKAIRELLIVDAVDCQGNIKSWKVPFSRSTQGEISFEEVSVSTSDSMLFLNPILKIWGLKEHSASDKL
jgi:hypothetical protein